MQRSGLGEGVQGGEGKCGGAGEGKYGIESVSDNGDEGRMRLSMKTR